MALLDDDELSQSNRFGVLTTPIDLTTRRGVDALVLARFEGTEAVSELFDYRIEALSHLPNIDFNEALGQQCSVRIKTHNGEHRDFHGILVEASRMGVAYGTFFGYRLILRPWLWLLTRTADCRIFLDKTVPQIIKEVFTDRNFGQGTHWISRIEDEGSFPKRDYCVQYRETDFNFVSRLMEKEGIYYYFTHKDGRHILVLANAKSSHDPILTAQLSRNEIAPSKEMPFLPGVANFAAGRQRIERLITERQFRSGVVELNDYNYETPNSQMAAIEIGEKTYERGDMEIYDYPGDYKDADQGLRYAEIVLQAEQARDKRRRAAGDAPSLFPGGLTQLAKVPQREGDARLQLPDSESGEYLVLRATHTYGEQTYRSAGGSEDADGGYQGTYELLHSDQHYRAPFTTPVPRIYGIQTAVVVDKQGNRRADNPSEEIEVEKLSEIYVSFFWDRRRHTEKRSVKLRCAQLWAGKKWGAQFIPRIGMEVLVEFLGGDPDRPVVTGCFYNGDNAYPYAMPGSKTQSGIKTNTVSGEGSNELRFEDMAGSEEVYIHAQKDMNEVVENDHTTTVHNNQTNTVDVDQTQSVGGNQTESVTGNQTMSVDGIRTVTIKGSQAVTIEGNKPNSGVSGSKLTITGDYKVDASNTIEIQAPTHIKLTCGGSSITMVPGKITLTAGGNATVVLDANALVQSAAGSKVLLDANALAQSSGGSKVLLDANALAQASGGAKVLLDANALAQSSGGSKVLLDGSALMSSPATATVQAPTATLAGGGGSVEAGGAGVTCAGGQVNVAGGMVNISGGLVKIN